MSFTEDDYQRFVARGLIAQNGQALPEKPSIALTQTPERAFQASVRRLALQSGFLIYHTHDSRRSDPGFPDLVLCRPGSLIFAELKTATGKLSEEQAVWVDVLCHSIPGVECYVWRPEDWPSITARLTAPMGKP